jgi:MFS family permease
MLASLARSFAPMVVAYLLLGAGVGAGTLVPCLMVTARWFERRRGLALGFTMSGTAFGASVLILIVSHVIARNGVRAAYLTLAAPLFLIVIPTVLMIVRVPTASGDAAGGVREAGDLPGLEVAEALRGRSFWLINLSALAYGFSVLGALMHIMPQSSENGFTTASAALAYSSLGMAAFVCKPLEGWVADTVTARVMLLLDHLATAIALIMLLGCRNVYLLVAFIAVWGFSSGAPFALIPMLITESLGLKRFGPFAGIAGGFQTAGATLAPVIAGYMYDVSGSHTSAFSLFCVIALTGAAATFGCAPLERQQRAETPIPSAATASS